MSWVKLIRVNLNYFLFTSVMENDHDRFQRILPRWFSEGLIMGCSDPNLLDWLKRQTPDTWHNIACGWNYDGDNAVVKWIAAHPECDKGTAIQLYRVDAPNWSDDITKLRPEYHDAWNTVKISEQRLLKNDFKTSELIPHCEPTHINPDKVRLFKIPSDAITFRGTRSAISDYTCANGMIMLTLDAFCQSIGEITPNV